MFKSFYDQDLKDTRSRDEPGAGAPVVLSKGGPLGRVGKKVQNIHNEKASMT